jgi:hypothetical protein
VSDASGPIVVIVRQYEISDNHGTETKILRESIQEITCSLN